MKNLAGKMAITVIAVVTLSAFTNWSTNGSPTRFFLNSAKIHADERGIDALDIEFKEQQIFLNVHTSYPMSCTEVVSNLGVAVLHIKRKTYEPICKKVTDTFLRITYTETFDA
jgi:hypothetical protein